MSERDPRVRPCENPACGAIDSTHCAFRCNVVDGQVVPSQREAAIEAGCRRVRFLDETAREATGAMSYKRYHVSYIRKELIFIEVVAESKAAAKRIALGQQPGERRGRGRGKPTKYGATIHREEPA